MNFNEWWLKLKLPATKSREQWDLLHSVARKAFNAGQKFERLRRLK